MEDLAEIRRRRAEEWRRARDEAAAAPTTVDTDEIRDEVQASSNGGMHQDEVTAVAQELPGPDHTNLTPCCRICFDSEESVETGRLFAPCRCTGSMRHVHVSCLNQWRAASTDESSYYRCNVCHYEYRTQRARMAVLLLCDGFQQCLAAALFLSGAVITGLICQVLAPGLLFKGLDILRLPAGVQLLFTASTTSRGNPACWRDGFTYEACCLVEMAGGRHTCWDSQYNFESCCKELTGTWLSLHAFVVPILCNLASGWMCLSAVGFGLFLLRQVHEGWQDANGQWNICVMAVWIASLGHNQIGRLAVVVGAAIALREIYTVLSVRAKHIATRCCDIVLEGG